MLQPTFSAKQYKNRHFRKNCRYARSDPMAEKKEYRNAVRSRMLIRAAFVSLMHEKPFEKIKATDIIKQANINRSTFYAHYPDVKGIMDEITDEIIAVFQSTLAEMDLSIFFENPRPILHQMVDLLQENQELYRLLGQSHMVYEYIEQLKRVLIQQIMETPDLPVEDRSNARTVIRIRLLLGGVIDVYRQWLSGEMTCSLDVLTEEVEKVIVDWYKGA